MISKQLGQTMVEYLVVVSALVSTMFWGANATCPNPHSELEYSNCIQNLLTTMHDKYEGYSNSMTAVHRYGEPTGDVFVSEWESLSASVANGRSGGSSLGEVPVGDDLSQSSQIVSADGTLTYGTLLGNDIVNENNEVIGTYDPDTGLITLAETGEQMPWVVVNVVVDGDGNTAALEAVVDCQSTDSNGAETTVYGFGYRNGLTNNFHNSLTLDEMDIAGFCTADSFRVVDVDGSVTSGAIVGNKYYDVTQTFEVSADSSLTPRAEVIDFLGEPEDCAILLDSTRFGPPPNFQDTTEYLDEQLRDWYNGDQPDSENPAGNANRLGSIDPTEGVSCTEQSRKVEAPVDDELPFNPFL